MSMFITTIYRVHMILKFLGKLLLYTGTYVKSMLGNHYQHKENSVTEFLNLFCNTK